MSNYSRDSYVAMFDQLLSQELCYSSSSASEITIKRAMKRILGLAIRQNLIKKYSNLVLDENLNVHFIIVDSSNSEFDLILYYGQ